MAIVEDVEEEEEGVELVKLPASPPDSTDLKTKLFAELARLELPADLLRVDKELPQPIQKLDQFKYTCLNVVQNIRSLLELQRESGFELHDEDVQELVFSLTKLIGKDDWCSPSVIREIRACLSILPTPPSMPRQLLKNKIKPIFSTHSHPDINPETSRKLLRPAGGEAARQDMFEGQNWKEYDGWGSWCVLSWCVEVMSKEDVTENIGLILPPLLILLDDYEPIYRLRGMVTLEIIMDRLSPVTMKRMGIDKLFLKSIQNSIALHPSFPQPVILPRSFSLLIRLLHIIFPPNTIERATEIAEAVDKGIINGWLYAPSGFEGIATLTGLAECVERLCDEVGVEVIRWLKSFIPSLLSPLFLPPTPFSIPLQISNLSALLAVLRAIDQTGRAGRWRGQILNALGRSWTGCVEKLEFGVSEEDDVRIDDLKSIQELCIKIGLELATVTPSLKEEELPAMAKLNERIFGPFAQAVSAGARGP